MSRSSITEPLDSPSYDRAVRSARLRGRVRICPECGAEAQATGRMLHYRPPLPDRWLIEYRCPNCDELQRVWTPADEPVIAAVLAELREGGGGASGDRGFRA